MARLVLSMLLPSPETELVTRKTWPHGPPLFPCISEVQSTRNASVYAARGSLAATAAFAAIKLDAWVCTVPAAAHAGVFDSPMRFRSAFASWYGSKPIE